MSAFQSFRRDQKGVSTQSRKAFQSFVHGIPDIVRKHVVKALAFTTVSFATFLSRNSWMAFAVHFLQ